MVFVNARIFSRSELRGRGSFRPSFVLAACCEPAAKALRVQSDEKTGRTGRTSLGRHRTFQCGIRRFQCRSRSTAGLLRGCMKCHGLLDCEIQRLRSDSYCFFQFGACYNAGTPAPGPIERHGRERRHDEKYKCSQSYAPAVLLRRKSARLHFAVKYAIHRSW